MLRFLRVSTGFYGFPRKPRTARRTFQVTKASNEQRDDEFDFDRFIVAGVRFAALLESAALPGSWRRSDRLRRDERLPRFLERVRTASRQKFPSPSADTRDA